MIFSPLEEIKNRLDVIDVVGQYLKLQKAGVNFRAVCPFHSEKKPSFFVSPARQIWHCFGCGAGGGIFDFVMRIEGVEFGDALRILAQKAGVELRQQDPRLETERRRSYEICELAARFFEKQLEESRVGREVQDYLAGRGLIQESIKKWRIGYAPDSWTGLSDFLVGQGYERDEAVKAGLSIKKEDSDRDAKYFDRFRSRIMFPVFDLQGQIVGFGGRIFKTEDTAKYVNTPGTILYDKSRILYGLDRARLPIRKNDECILVEGYMDVILLSQAGYENVVATSGTALTSFQLKILKRYSDNILTAFDMDVAGDTATKRGIDLAQAQGFNLKVVMMPEGKDPADVASEKPELFGELAAKARSITDFYFEGTLSRFDASSPEGKRKIAKILLPVIKRIPNAIERAHWRQKLALALQVKEEDVEDELKKVQTASQSINAALDEGEEIVSQVPRSRRDIIEERVVSLLFKHPHYISLVQDNHLPLFSLNLRDLLESARPQGGFPAIFATDKSDLEPQLQYLLLRAESEEGEDANPEEEIVLALGELVKLDRKKRLEEVTSALKVAEAERDIRRAEALLQEFYQLSKESDLL